MATSNENEIQSSQDDRTEIIGFYNLYSKYIYTPVPEDHIDYKKLSTSRNREGKPVWGMAYWYNQTKDNDS